MCVWIKVKGKSIAMHLLPQTIPHPAEKDDIGSERRPSASLPRTPR